MLTKGKQYKLLIKFHSRTRTMLGSELEAICVIFWQKKKNKIKLAVLYHIVIKINMRLNSK